MTSIGSKTKLGQPVTWENSHQQKATVPQEKDGWWTAARFSK